MNASVARAISGLNAEESLRECKKKAIKRAKCQSGSRKVVQKDGVLRAGEGSEQIISRHLDEVEQARRKAKLKGRRGKPRKALERQLDVLAALDDPNRSIPRAEQAVSV